MLLGSADLLGFCPQAHAGLTVFSAPGITDLTVTQLLSSVPLFPSSHATAETHPEQGSPSSHPNHSPHPAQEQMGSFAKYLFSDTEAQKYVSIWLLDHSGTLAMVH